MHVIIVGCGRVGSSLAVELIGGGHTVAVIDRDSRSFARLGTNFAGDTVEGIGFDRDRLIDAGVERATAVAAVTNGDNSNILVARVARENFAVDRVVARIYDPRRAVIYQRLGIPTVATVAWTSDQVLRRLLPQSHPPEWSDGGAGLCLVERALDDSWAGTAIDELEESIEARLAGINRLGTAVIPTSRTVAQAGDVAYIMVAAERLQQLDTALLGPVGGDR